MRRPEWVVPAGHHPAEYLAQLSFEGLFKILASRSIEQGSADWVDYTGRLKHELKVIADRGFSAFIFNPLTGFLPTFAEIEIVNIDVDGNNTYFAEGILVHNKGSSSKPVSNAAHTFTENPGVGGTAIS